MVGLNTKKYYYCTHEEDIEETLKKGIMPGRGSIIIPRLSFGVELEGPIMLWRNLGILEGTLYQDLLSNGYGFLSVDLPPDHPIERDYSGMGSIAKNHIQLCYLILQMKIPFDIRQFMDEEELRKLKRDISELSKEEKAKVSFERVIGKVANDEKNLTFILDSALDENWDTAVGFYRTSQPIPPHDPYRIQRHNQ